MWKTALAGTVIMGLSLMAVGCGSSDTTASKDNAGDSTGTVKEYKVGTDATYAPFESKDGETIKGFDIDVLNAIGEATNTKFTFQHIPWDGLFLSLNNGDVDVVASAVTITDERKKTFDFSEPYFEATQMIVSKKGSGIKSLNDLKGKVVAVQGATTGEEVVSKLLGQDSKNIKRFEAMPLALLELKNGGADAAVGDNGVVLEYVKNNSGDDLETIVDTSFEKEHYGFAVKKGNTELLKVLNDGIKKIKENGKLDEINKKYGFKK
jgi:ABC-type amino acid transport substrate-binding protein